MMHGIAHICRYNKIAQVGSEERDICENVIHNKNQQPQKLVCQQNIISDNHTHRIVSSYRITRSNKRKHQALFKFFIKDA